MVAKVSEQERINQINNLPNIKFVRWDGEFKGSKSKAVCRCEIDGYEWPVTVNNLISAGRGCPQCSGLRRWIPEECVERINNTPNVKFVRWDGEFKGVASKAICRCEVDGCEWSATVGNLVNKGSGCPQCGGTIKRAPEEYIEMIDDLPNITFIHWDGEFKGGRSKAVCRCDVDGYEWSVGVKNLVYKNQGCPQCSSRRRWKPEEYIERVDALPNIKFIRWLGEFKGSKSKAVYRCEIDGYEWSTSIDHLLNRGTGCPYCARYGKTEEQPAPNVTVEIPTDVKPAFDLLNW